MSSTAVCLREKHREESDGRQERAHAVDELEARRVGELAEHRRADPAESEGEAEKYA